MVIIKIWQYSYNCIPVVSSYRKLLKYLDFFFAFAIETMWSPNLNILHFKNASHRVTIKIKCLNEQVLCACLFRIWTIEEKTSKTSSTCYICQLKIYIKHK